MGHIYQLDLVIESSEKYKKYLEEIVFDYAGVSDNIAYHLAYLEYLYQLNTQIPLNDYPVIHGLRIKTIITEIASCAEVLIYDSLTNLQVTDKWSGTNFFKLNPRVGFAVMLQYAKDYDIITKSLYGRLHQLFDLRHKIHLTHKRRDPFEFNVGLLAESENTFEDMVKHFLETRYRNVSEPNIDPGSIPFPWAEAHSG